MSDAAGHDSVVVVVVRRFLLCALAAYLSLLSRERPFTKLAKSCTSDCPISYMQQ